ncbi:hypothetical protein MNBD_PLANCTO02-1350 [hydrothermal vent metagenome]|uniref:SSU ribosomal protein S6p n=1 Tax=hydrothermal vent metagenome TaxID=652676 RepID=A0A3B1DYN4_9ZZZZ
MSESKTKYPYEGMFLLNSNAYAADPEGSVENIIALLEKSGATITAHRPWQEGRLAYEIEEQRKGLHYIVMFEMPGDGVSTLARSVKLSTLVLRHLVIRHTPMLFDAMVAALSGEETSEEDEATKTSPAVEEKTVSAVE